MEECVKLTELTKEVEQEDKIEGLRTRDLRGRKKEKGDVKDRGKEEQKGEKMEYFFYSIYEFLTNAEKFDVTNFFCSNFPPADVDDVVCFFFCSFLIFILKLRPMPSIGRPEASNTQAPS